MLTDKELIEKYGNVSNEKFEAAIKKILGNAKPVKPKPSNGKGNKKP